MARNAPVEPGMPLAPGDSLGPCLLVVKPSEAGFWGRDEVGLEGPAFCYPARCLVPAHAVLGTEEDGKHPSCSGVGGVSGS